MKLKITINDKVSPKNMDKTFLLPSWVTLYSTTIDDGVHQPVVLETTKQLDGMYYIGRRYERGVNISLNEQGELSLWCGVEKLKTIEWSEDNYNDLIKELKENTFHTNDQYTMESHSIFGGEEKVIEWKAQSLFDTPKLIIDGEEKSPKAPVIRIVEEIIDSDAMKEYILFIFPDDDHMVFSRDMANEYLGRK